MSSFVKYFHFIHWSEATKYRQDSQTEQCVCSWHWQYGSAITHISTYVEKLPKSQQTACFLLFGKYFWFFYWCFPPILGGGCNFHSDKIKFSRNLSPLFKYGKSVAFGGEGGYSEKFSRKQILGSVSAAWSEFHRAGNFWTWKNPFVFFSSCSLRTSTSRNPDVFKSFHHWILESPHFETVRYLVILVLASGMIWIPHNQQLLKNLQIFWILFSWNFNI